MPVILTIEFDLTRQRAILRTPLSVAEFTDTESDRARLFRAIRAAAEYRAGIFRRNNSELANAGKDVSDAVLAYATNTVRKYTEKGREIDVLKSLQIDLDMEP